jgi:hypothetical protein
MFILYLFVTVVLQQQQFNDTKDATLFTKGFIIMPGTVTIISRRIAIHPLSLVNHNHDVPDNGSLPVDS